MSDTEGANNISKKVLRSNSIILITDDEDEKINDSASSLSSRPSSTTSQTSNNNQQLNHLNGHAKSKGRGRHARQNSKIKCTYKCVNWFKEDHGGSIFGIHLNMSKKNGDNWLFSTVGKNQLSIYEISDSGKVKFLQCYIDPEKDENYYTSAWTTDSDGKCLIAVAGENGVIRLINPYIGKCVKHFVGHGHAVNEMTFYPNDGNILVSAAKDHTIRIWNIKSDVCIAILGGIEGHRDEVLSVDIHLDNKYITSSGMDHSLKIWNIGKKEITDAVKFSYKFQLGSKPFPTVLEHFAEFSTRGIHKNYVDCVRWCGNCIMSKSCENQIILWRPGKYDENHVDYTKTKFFSILHVFDMKDNDIWYMRFSFDYWKKSLSAGNQQGKIYCWNLDVDNLSDSKAVILQHPKLNSTVRQTQFNYDGSLLLAACDDGTIWIWQKQIRD